MKIAYITPGSGGTFYCQNCFRDDDLIIALQELGHDIQKVPLYLPSKTNPDTTIKNTPVFYGAINIFLREKLPLYKKAPKWLIKMFNSQAFLKYAAKKSGSTKATGLEEMTISMLNGEKGRQAFELTKLIQYLKEKIQPDIVHLSNALLLGLAKKLRHDLNTVIVCSLQDENEWIDLMDQEYQTKIWNLMAEKIRYVDLFITTSEFYAKKSQSLMKIEPEKVKVILGGINLEDYERSILPFNPPVIGFLCRMSKYFGLDILIKAWIQIKKESSFKNLKLHITGGYTKDDKSFVNEMLSLISKNGFEEDVLIFKDFNKLKRVQFLKSLTLLSVPVPSGEAFGAYQVEALASGVPIVQPHTGYYPEFIKKTGGGVIFEPNTSQNLAKTIVSLLEKKEQLLQMGEQGRKSVQEFFSIDEMAKKMTGIYKNILKEK